VLLAVSLRVSSSSIAAAVHIAPQRLFSAINSTVRSNIHRTVDLTRAEIRQQTSARDRKKNS
jgi:hypothetical protein